MDGRSCPPRSPRSGPRRTPSPRPWRPVPQALDGSSRRRIAPPRNSRRAEAGEHAAVRAVTDDTFDRRAGGRVVAGSHTVRASEGRRHDQPDSCDRSAAPPRDGRSCASAEPNASLRSLEGVRLGRKRAQRSDRSHREIELRDVRARAGRVQAEAGKGAGSPAPAARRRQRARRPRAAAADAASRAPAAGRRRPVAVPPRTAPSGLSR
jgi:hypothetical protein